MKRIVSTCAVLTAVGAMSGCHESSNAVHEGLGAPVPPESLEGSLNQLGIDTDETPRLDDTGEPYPDSYGPLGQFVVMREVPDTAADASSDETKVVLGRPEELLVGGLRNYNNTDAYFTVIDEVPAPELTGAEVFPLVLDEEAAQWAREEYVGSTADNTRVRGTMRDATAADINGNGFREPVIVYYDPVNDPSNIHFRVLQSQSLPPWPDAADVAIPIDATYFPLYDLRATSGDFDGDGIDEVAFAVSSEPIDGVSSTPVGLYLIDDAATGFRVLREHHLDYQATLTSPFVTLVVTAVRLDHDGFGEIALVVNENLAEGSSGSFASQYFVFDSAVSESDPDSTSLSVLSNGPVAGEITGADGLPVEHELVVANVTGGDLDGDSIDELIFAGLDEVIGNCSRSDVTGLRHFLFVKGNEKTNFADIAGNSYLSVPDGCDAAEGIFYRFVHVNVLDFDGDGDNDIQANQYVFDEALADAADQLPDVIGQVAGVDFMTVDGQAARFDRSNTAITISDQTGDGIDDVININLLAEQDFQSGAHVWAWNQETDAGQRIAQVPMFDGDAISGGLMNPLLIPTDVDNDTVEVYEFNGTHYLDFTEPIILAVLAAAPCIRGIDQNTTDSCSTSWGSAQTGATGDNFTTTVSGSAGWGFGGAGAGISTKVIFSVTAAARRQISLSYELTKSRTFSTGPFEDGVVFTSIPMDRYEYRRLQPIRSLLGSRIDVEILTVNLPRDLDMRLVTRRYFNDSLTNNPDNAPLRISDEVFQHVPGDLSTYPSAADKDEILATERSLIEARRSTEFRQGRFDPVEALGGLEVGPVAVSEGSGSTELGLEYVETVGEANALELGFEFEAETIAGTGFNVSIGASVERELTISHGDASLFSGSIGSIPSENYAENDYRFGLFAYLKALGDQEFEVVNFWVEED